MSFLGTTAWKDVNAGRGAVASRYRKHVAHAKSTSSNRDLGLRCVAAVPDWPRVRIASALGCTVSALDRMLDGTGCSPSLRQAAERFLETFAAGRIAELEASGKTCSSSGDIDAQARRHAIAETAVRRRCEANVPFQDIARASGVSVSTIRLMQMRTNRSYRDACIDAIWDGLACAEGDAYDQDIYDRHVASRRVASSMQASEDTGPWTVYLLQCSDGTMYVGACPQSSDEAIVALHNDKRGGPYTARLTPVRMLWSMPCDNRDMAAREACRVKRMTPLKKRELAAGSAARAAAARAIAITSQAPQRAG